MRAAVLGSPIAHSLSPVLHRAAYADLGLDWSYTAIDCDEAGLPALLARVRADPQWVGLSLTMPLKTAVLPLLDVVSEVAATLGAANTVLFGGGRARGENTDVTGLRAALAELLPSSSPSAPSAGGAPAEGARLPEEAVVLGGGGTARAALAALAWSGVRRVRVVLRRAGAGEPLVALGAAAGTEVRVESWDLAPAVVRAAGVVVATTPAGATDALAADLAATGGWPVHAALLDVLYAPWPTPLAAAAGRAGAPVVGGLAVLVGQAAEQVRLMTGRAAPVEAMRVAGEAALAARAAADRSASAAQRTTD